MFAHELNAALLARDPIEALTALAASDGCARAFPELPALAMPDGAGRHKDVLAHSIAVCAKTPPRLEVRLAALLHDIGKPATRNMHGRTVTFHAHEAVGARIVRRRLPELGYDADVVDRVARIVGMSGRFKEYSDDEGGWTDSAVRRYAADAGDVIDDLLALCRVDVTSKHQWKHQRQRDQVDALTRRIREVREADEQAAERPDLDGRAIMDHLGVEPGPVVGDAWAMLLAAKRDAGRELDVNEAYALLDRWWADRQAS